MPLVKCEFHIYNIDSCGIYEAAGKNSKHLSAKKLLKELKEWAIDSNKSLIETSTFNSSGGNLESYCLDLVEYNNQYLLSLWNRVHHQKSGVGLVNGTKPSHEAKVSHAKIGKEDIPGYPSFFWFIPSKGKVVALKVENPSLGIGQLKNYIKGYIDGFCSHRVKRKDGDAEIEGFSDFPAPTSGKDSRLANPRLRGRFSISPQKIPGKQDEIIDRHRDITKLVKDVFVHDNLTDAAASTVERISSFFRDLPPTQRRKLRIQMPAKVTYDEIENIIKAYNDSGQDESENMGFIFKGNSNHIEWLSGSFKKEESNVDIVWRSENHPDAEKLIKNLQAHIAIVEEVDEYEESNAEAM